MTRGKKGRPTLQLGPLDTGGESGASSLISGFTTVAAAAPLEEINISAIAPRLDQPRRSFPQESLQKLAESIQEFGILQPLAVLKMDAEGEAAPYMLIAGERRLRAAELVGLKTVPAKIFRDLTFIQIQQMAALENLQREDLNPVDETDALVDILAAELGCDRDNVPAFLEHLKSLKMRKAGLEGVSPADRARIEAVERLFRQLSKGEWTSFVSNRLPILRLPDELLRAVRTGYLDYTKALVLRRLSEAQRWAMIDRAAGLSIHQLRREVKDVLGEEASPAEATVQAWEALRDARHRQVIQRLPAAEQARVQALLVELNEVLSSAPRRRQKRG